jgi:multidrug efflux system membrane fusion protein
VRATLSQAREGMRHARRDLSRARTLARGGSLATANLEDATTSARLARGQLAAAGFEMRYATLRAPADGWVDARLADPGEVVGPGQLVLRVASRAMGWVLRVAVPDRAVSRLVEGSDAEVQLDAAPDQRIAARIVDIARMPTPGTGTFDVDLAIDAPEETALRTGLVGRATIPIGAPLGASVPVSALVEGRDREAAVFAIEGDRVRRAPVRIAFFVGERAVISEGLEGIDAVVTTGADRLADGSAIAVSED